ncbi:hypothetical protein BSF_29870 [Bacillus subtilis]|uniref:Uncharacterized protein n=1 Tax=Bacillus halotolerans TaxID=260554 RepID=A0ABY7HXN5_9BACI|nr:hypothetical protein [Bacillus halotolerans]WAT20426.1 hypothetical protein O0R52_15855 [Bacillus halotolerans]BDG81258.1 hypothetical protein BSF_29870 [Bacillus subtilis]
MKLEPIELGNKGEEEKTEVEKLKEQVLDLQRVCNMLMNNQT